MWNPFIGGFRPESSLLLVNIAVWEGEAAELRLRRPFITPTTTCDNKITEPLKKNMQKLIMTIVVGIIADRSVKHNRQKKTNV